MYDVSSDPRCIKSCTLIKDAFFELLKERNYNLAGVEVSDIASRSGVSRATFYRHFETTLDILHWVSNEEVEYTSDFALLSTRDYTSFCKQFFTYWSEHSEFLELLVKVGHPDVFFNSLERSLTRNADRIFRGSRLTEVRQEYMITVWSGIVWSILKKWVVRGKVETAEDLIDVALKNLPKPR